MAIEVDVMTNPELDAATQEDLSNLAKDAIGIVLKLEGYCADDAEVSVLFTSDAFIAELNEQYRGVQGPTDVLSFAMMDAKDELDSIRIEGIPQMLGDIVISLETARREASSSGKSLEEEISLLLVHGTLHLLGYDHDAPESEAVMWKHQEEALKAVAQVRN